MDKVLETVIEGIEFTFEKDILVKPLEPVMITKEYEEQIFLRQHLARKDRVAAVYEAVIMSVV